MNRRHFLIGLLLAANGCRPANLAIPTAYVPGSAALPTTLTPNTTRTSLLSSPEPIPGTVPLTSVDHLYVHSFRTTPQVDAANWSLVIDGLVAQSLHLSLADLQALPAVESMRTLECIGNGVGGGLIGNIIWRGVRISELFARAGVYTQSRYALFEAADGYTTSVALDWLKQPDTLLVYAADGQPLTPEHGYPARLLIPGLYGQKMPKWITRMTFSDQDKLGYWEGPVYGWSNLAAVRTNSQITMPGRNARFASVVRVAGVAYAGKRAITQVEVRIGNAKSDPWLAATLVKPPTPLAWTYWVYDWQPPAPGSYTLSVRASDDTGFTQFRPANGLMAGTYPDGTDAIHSISVQLA